MDLRGLTVYPSDCLLLWSLSEDLDHHALQYIRDGFHFEVHEIIIAIDSVQMS